MLLFTSAAPCAIVEENTGERVRQETTHAPNLPRDLLGSGLLCGPDPEHGLHGPIAGFFQVRVAYRSVPLLDRGRNATGGVKRRYGAATALLDACSASKSGLPATQPLHASDWLHGTAFSIVLICSPSTVPVTATISPANLLIFAWSAIS